MSSQKHIQNPKKLASPSKERLLGDGAVLVVVLTGGLMMLSGLEVVNVPQWCIAIASLFLVAASVFQLYRLDHEEEQREDLEREIESFPAEEFVRGMNEFGVEMIIGGAQRFGSQAEVKLRFPATILHKHLVDAMVYGYRTHLQNEGIRLKQSEELMMRDRFQRTTTAWIEQMTQGFR